MTKESSTILTVLDDASVPANHRFSRIGDVFVIIQQSLLLLVPAIASFKKSPDSTNFSAMNDDSKLWIENELPVPDPVGVLGVEAQRIVDRPGCHEMAERFISNIEGTKLVMSELLRECPVTLLKK